MQVSSEKRHINKPSTILENAWADVHINLELVKKSYKIWMEYVGFKHFIEHTMVLEFGRSTNAKEMIHWLIKRLEHYDQQAALCCYPCYDEKPPTEWLDWYTPRLNQSVLLATATPPVTLDMSTTENHTWRLPFQRPAFPQYRQSLTVAAIPVSMAHQHHFNERVDGALY